MVDWRRVTCGSPIPLRCRRQVLSAIKPHRKMVAQMATCIVIRGEISLESYEPKLLLLVGCKASSSVARCQRQRR